MPTQTYCGRPTSQVPAEQSINIQNVRNELRKYGRDLRQKCSQKGNVLMEIKISLTGHRQTTSEKQEHESFARDAPGRFPVATLKAGSDVVLRSRLHHFKRNLVTTDDKPWPIMDYLVVIDFEATCTKDETGVRQPGDYSQEIIEFPAILIDVKQKRQVDYFHSYCRPRIEPKLSAFCTELTGITQEMVDEAPDFETVMQHFEGWLARHGLLGNPNWCIACDSCFDLCAYLYNQCRISNILYPVYAECFLQISRAFNRFYLHYDLSSKWVCLRTMLHHYGMVFEGRRHCGLDDAHNISRICLKMLEDTADLRPTDKVLPHIKVTEFSCGVYVFTKPDWRAVSKNIWKAKANY